MIGFAVYMYNGVFSSSGSIRFDGEGLIYNCFLSSSSSNTPNIELGSTIKGSTLIGHINNGQFNPAFFYDSILDGHCIFSDPSSTSDHCVFTDAALPSGTHTNYQLNWSPPSMPAWNSPRASFSSILLSSGINTPIPGFGVSPYTGYEKGLWNSSRVNNMVSIGAMDFIVPLSYFLTGSVGDNTSVTSVINQTVLVAAIGGSDDYFDSTNKLGYAFVYYTHQDGRQTKRLYHGFDSTNSLVSNVIWTDDAKDGTWAKSRLRVFDKDGAEHVMSRTDIGVNEDITHSGGVMHLNTI